MPRPEVRIYIDGGARGNPGPAGFGMVVSGPAGEPLGRYFGYLGEQTNNVAEYRALLAALEHARALGWKRIWVGSDSELMVRQVRGEYRVKNEGLRPLFERCRDLAVGFEEFSIEHLPREQNAEADRLANRAMNLRASELPPGAESGAPVPRLPAAYIRAGALRHEAPAANSGAGEPSRQVELPFGARRGRASAAGVGASARTRNTGVRVRRRKAGAAARGRRRGSKRVRRFTAARARRRTG